MSIMTAPTTRFNSVALCVLALAGNLARVACADGTKYPLHIAVRPVLPLNAGDPEVVIRYCNARGEAPIRIRLPEGDTEISGLREVNVRVDGTTPDYAVDWERWKAEPKRSKVIDLEPQDCVELRVKLGTVFKMPREWQKIKIRTARILWVRAEVTGTLVLEKALPREEADR